MTTFLPVRPSLTFLGGGLNAPVGFVVGAGERVWFFVSNRGNRLSFRVDVVYDDGSTASFAMGEGGDVVFARNVAQIGCDMTNTTSVRLDVWRERDTRLAQSRAAEWARGCA